MITSYVKAVVAVLAISVSTGLAPCASAQNAPATAKNPSVSFPKDIYPDSATRLPLLKREDLDEEGKRNYDFYAPNGGLRGPGGVMLYNPKLGWLLKDVDRYLRFGTNLPRRVVILATLVAAREMNSPVIWSRKEAEARQEGLEPHLIDVVKYHKSVSGLAEDEALIISYGRELFEKRKVRSETFAHAVKLLGGQGVVTMTSVMGFYTSLALLLRAVDMQLVPGEKPCTAPPLAPGEAYRCLP